MRILAKAGDTLPLTSMGMSERNFRELRAILDKPYGMILVVGPTGSGKTTTLHAALHEINTPDRKIWTAEDPVEITQYGLRQVQVQSKIGFDFAAAMRAFLRADPDVIMVGEMRDFETAKTGVEASLTGHLVFSTLHTNSAPETIVRLLDMGIDPLNFADALLGILAQRLVRTLCKKCKEAYHPDRKEFDEIVQSYGEEQFLKLNIPYDDKFTLYRPKGCDVCDKYGIQGPDGDPRAHRRHGRHQAADPEARDGRGDAGSGDGGGDDDPPAGRHLQIDPGGHRLQAGPAGLHQIITEPIAKLVNSVTPVKTGVQNVLKRLDAGFRRHDVEGIMQLALFSQCGADVRDNLLRELRHRPAHCRGQVRVPPLREVASQR